ncbi:hypothetical protein F5148DRAFT_1224817 [Russula earlei]|uniref:Uncharacterized protein n=1 Tax=Russula earlei TaxID=71964 RepID=A0ACC0U0E3_9AGAM|nr:hypothetical protein F5148DRAFT_1224817 [Russula earlei]
MNSSSRLGEQEQNAMAVPTVARSCASIARHRPHSRLLSYTNVLHEDAPAHVGIPPSPRKPIGGIRGSVIGFLFGFSLASSFAAYRLLDEYKVASTTLQASVEELQQSTERVSAHVRRIEAVEKDLKALSHSSASKDDLSQLRAEVKKIYDGLHIEFLDLRTYVWGLQQDVHSITGRGAKNAKQAPPERI